MRHYEKELMHAIEGINEYSLIEIGFKEIIDVIHNTTDQVVLNAAKDYRNQVIERVNDGKYDHETCDNMRQLKSFQAYNN